MTVEVSGVAKLHIEDRLKGGEPTVGIRLASDLVKFYNLRPGMRCRFKLFFDEKHDIIETDEAEAIAVRQKELQKIDKFAETRLRQWYNDMKEVYERGKKDSNFKVPEHVRRLFEQPDELEKVLARISK